MDPLSLIVAAVAAGIAASAGKVGESLITDAYSALKQAIKNKLGIDSKAAKAVEELEQDAESEGQKLVLKEQLKKAGAEQDADLVRLATVVLEQLKAQPGGAQIVQQATGSYIAQASQGSSASVNVDKKD